MPAACGGVVTSCDQCAPSKTLGAWLGLVVTEEDLLGVALEGLHLGPLGGAGGLALGVPGTYTTHPPLLPSG